MAAEAPMDPITAFCDAATRRGLVYERNEEAAMVQLSGSLGGRVIIVVGCNETPEGLEYATLFQPGDDEKLRRKLPADSGLVLLSEWTQGSTGPT